MVQIIWENNADIVGGIIEIISSGLIKNVISIAQSSRFGVGVVKFWNKDTKEAGYINTLANVSLIQFNVIYDCNILSINGYSKLHASLQWSNLEDPNLDHEMLELYY